MSYPSALSRRVKQQPIMEQPKNTIRISEKGKLVIHTDNATCIDNDVITDIYGRTFEISGSDVIILKAMLDKKKVSCVTKGGPLYFDSYIIVGENADCKELIEAYTDLKNRIEKFNNTRHWWERKI